MAWIKRNLIVVISGAVALLLIGGGVWYLLQAMDKNKAMDDEIGGLRSELNTLVSKPVSPNQQNISAAQAEVKRVNEFIVQAKAFFPSSPAPEGQLNNQTFAALLHNTVADLHKEATAAGILVASNYHFSFETQWPAVSFPPASLHPLSERLSEVKQLASLLFKAKVNSLISIQRARVTDEVPGATAAGDYLPEAPHLSESVGTVMWPYQLTFQTFTPELATVLEQISRMPEAYVVRSVVVEPAEALPAQRPPPGAPPGTPPGAPPVRPGRNALRPPGTPAAPATSGGLETILNERLLRVVMRIEVIKPAK